jgi:uncharacterized protein (DUF2461 family)
VLPIALRDARRGHGTTIPLHLSRRSGRPLHPGPDPPLVEHLKRKDFAVGATWDERRACAPDFLERCAESYRTAAPLTEWLTRALGLSW